MIMILWIVLAFVAGSLFGGVTMSLLASGNRSGEDIDGGGEKGPRRTDNARI